MIGAPKVNDKRTLYVGGLEESVTEATLRAAGVRCRLSLPAVGEGLQDHGAVTVAYECSIADGMSEIKPWMPYLNVLSPLALLKWAT